MGQGSVWGGSRAWEPEETMQGEPVQEQARAPLLAVGEAEASLPLLPLLPLMPLLPLLPLLLLPLLAVVPGPPMSAVWTMSAVRPTC